MQIIESGLVESGRRVRLKVTLRDRPGMLAFLMKVHRRVAAPAWQSRVVLLPGSPQGLYGRY